MGIGFIIMQIGDNELDEMCAEAIVPAMEACQLEPKRVDKHNDGGLLKSEIISFIENSEIIVADLTNERPNCYLEVGYAMGANRWRQIVLTARQDHFHDDDAYDPKGPKVHFDLAGYDILYWDPENLGAFRVELEKRIRRRQERVTAATGTPSTPFDDQWFENCRTEAIVHLENAGYSAYMELSSKCDGVNSEVDQKKLLDAVFGSQVKTFAMPIGNVMAGEARPRPTQDGVVAIMKAPWNGEFTFDYWKIRNDGSWYFLRNLVEDETPSERASVNAVFRICRLTEALVFCSDLYDRLGAGAETPFSLRVRHAGLAGRKLDLRRNQPGRFIERTATEGEIESVIRVAREEIRKGVVEPVFVLAKPLFLLFDFYEVKKSFVDDIVTNFMYGRIA